MKLSQLITRAGALPAQSSAVLRRLPWVLSSLDSPGQVLGYLGPNWFASIMGTGIVANAAATLPIQITGLHTFALIVWLAATVLLIGLIVAVVAHWVHHPSVARSHAYNPQMAQFYGAPPMAFLTVGAGALLVGKSVIGTEAAVDFDWILWSAGTIGGLFTAIYIPYLLFTEHQVEPDAAFGGWLMPVVPPMVSAATGALLIPHVAPGSGRATLLYGCYAMFGLSLMASIIIITMIWSRLAHYGTSGTSRVPTLWIVLGPLGQSMTAAGLLGANAKTAVDRQLADGMSVFAVLFGVPVWGFAVLWAALAASLTIRTARQKLPFALTWWSFTFPVGTFVTGTTALAIHTGLPAFRWAAVVAYVGLVVAWLLVAAGTAHGSLRGELFRVPEGSGPIRASKEPADASASTTR
ncbi:MAG: TDT family transporter [Chloroflexota bacterium]